jgi:hypothetical protein
MECGLGEQKPLSGKQLRAAPCGGCDLTRAKVTADPDRP